MPRYRLPLRMLMGPPPEATQGFFHGGRPPASSTATMRSLTSRYTSFRVTISPFFSPHVRTARPC